MRLMPYLAIAAEKAHRDGVPMMRPMVLEFPDDPTAACLDRQYMLGPDLLVVPVMSTDGLGSVIPCGAVSDRPGYSYADGVQLMVFAPAERQRTVVRIPSRDGGLGAEIAVSVTGGTATAKLLAGAASAYDCVVTPGAVR